VAGQGRGRLRELGVEIGRVPTARWNAITDVTGVRVGHATIVEGEGDLVVGRGPIRTGVTVIQPHEGHVWDDPLFAGYHRLNGNGEMTGTAWIEESGLLTSPIAITNTHSVGVVRDALVAYEVRNTSEDWKLTWSLPVVGETYDGILSDIDGFHVTADHLFAAIEDAADGPVLEGCVGGGTGMICHGFKGGIGTSSRLVPEEYGGWIVGVLVQANYGSRHLLRIDGVPVGEILNPEVVPLPGPMALPRVDDADTGSIIIVVATDAPLLPHQCKRLAQRATMGLARMGSIAGDGSGDLFLTFSTGNRNVERPGNRDPLPVRSVANDAISTLFEAVVDATEEAITNALCMATTTTGIYNRVAYAIPLDRLESIMRDYRRVH
jgi:D-aminopeptidase